MRFLDGAKRQRSARWLPDVPGGLDQVAQEETAALLLFERRWMVAYERDGPSNGGTARQRGGLLVCGWAVRFGLLHAPLDFIRIPPIQALYLSALVSGLVAPVILVLLMRAAMSKEVMGNFTLPRGLLIGGWLAAAVMTAMAVALIVTLF